ncbi:MAG: cysteine--tRNA ligase [Bacteroidales bacterium]|nr:cysteine--tRNA ligase [Bacteroidales bacterium]MDY0217250.1 cysteine--tRNA ligase [Bacteroidales bacterium]
MEHKIQVYNTLSRKKEEFIPINPPLVGMYVCGPTVYGDPHLGHARPAITFDLIFRYLKHLGFKVRYVRNITDVGHLENDADEGEDKIGKKARLEQIEPMEVAQYYIDRYHLFMDKLNVLRPSIEPRASGHIIEQIEIVEKILNAGYAYESAGSIYFDVEKYNKEYKYGILSGRVLEDLIANTRALDGQDEKRNPADFALWKKASPEHIMRWKSPWSDGFPGWHVECTAMGNKYLGEQFDIHGGGMDLLFPHHESEICQSQIAHGVNPAKYWIHNNMITINGQKMGKSLGNFINLEEFFTGSHQILEKAYDPMTIRYFILQAHYRSTVDFSNDALIAAEKGMNKLLQTQKTLANLKAGATSTEAVEPIIQSMYDAMNDDFNSPVLIAQLFDASRLINTIKDGKASLTESDLNLLKVSFNIFMNDILGLKSTSNATNENQDKLLNGLMDLVLDFRQQAKSNKDWTTSDKIRDHLKNLNIIVKDTKEGVEWNLE